MVWIKRVLIVLALIIAIDVVATWRQYKRAVVCVSNATAVQISNVRVGTGKVADRILGEIPVGGRQCLEVSPQGESGVVLAFDVPSKKGISWTGGYIERSGGYEMTITITAPDSISEQTRLLRGYLLLPLIGSKRR